MSVKRNRLGLIAAVAILSAISLPRSTSAQDIYGTWNGAVNYNIEDLVNGQIVGYSQGGYAGTLSVGYYDSPQILSMEISGFSYLSFYGNLADPYGPTSTGFQTVYQYGFFYGPIVGNFDLNYQSILPDGSIDTAGGTASADITGIYADAEGNGEIVFVSFNTVPEPAAIVLALTAMLAIGLFAWIRCLSRRARDGNPVAS